jgi:aspartate/methionine/tyrosine aminotransferase
MKLHEFKVERLFVRSQQGVDYQFGASSCEDFELKYLLERADSECLEMWENLRLGYTNFRGHPKLRAAIARRYKTIGPDDIIEASPEEGAFIVLNTMLDEGDEVIVMEPAMPSLHEIPHAIGCDVVPWRLEPTEWGWRLDIDFLSRAINQRTRLIILNIPNNPTGYAPVLTDLQRIAQIADRRGIWVFSEESYRGMERDPGSVIPPMADVYHRAISIGGLSRNGFPGTGVGWIASQNRSVMANFLAYKDYTSLCPNAMSEIIAIIFFRNIQEITLRNRKIILENVDLAEAYFKNHKELFEWTPPNAGSTAFPKLLPPRRSNEFCDSAMKDAGLMIIPDRTFSVNLNRFRIGFGKKNFGMALAKFSDFVDAYMAKSADSEDSGETA